jgi:hypothetical protein
MSHGIRHESKLRNVVGFIIVTEFCERIAYYGFAGSLVSLYPPAAFPNDIIETYIIGIAQSFGYLEVQVAAENIPRLQQPACLQWRTRIPNLRMHSQFSHYQRQRPIGERPTNLFQHCQLDTLSFEIWIQNSIEYRYQQYNCQCIEQI